MTEKVFENLCQEAYACLDQGLCYDEVGNHKEAREFYEKGLDLLNEAAYFQEMAKTEIYEKLVNLRSKVEIRLIEMKSPSTSNERNTIAEMRYQLENAENTEVELLFSIPDGVQIVVIRGEETSAPTPPSALDIFRIHDSYEISKIDISNDHLSSQNVPKAFIKVGPWAYPLIPGQTPVLQNEHGIYVVPNPTPEDPDMCVGIILPQDQLEVEKKFVEVLKKYSVVRTSNIEKSLTPEEKIGLSKKIAIFLIMNGQKLATKVENGGEKASAYIIKRGEAKRSKVKPREEPANVSPVVQKGVVYLHKGTKVVANATTFLLDKIGSVGTAVGTKVADSVKEGDGRGKRAARSTLTVAGGGFASAGLVFVSLEKAAKTMFKSFANESVETTRLKYGDEAAETSNRAFKATGHAASAGFNVINLGPKQLVGRVVMQGVGTAGIGVLSADGIPLGANPVNAETTQDPEKNSIQEKFEEKEKIEQKKFS